MNLFIAIISIFSLAFVAVVLNKIIRRNLVCPICAGVSGTWLWMLAARALGYGIDVLIAGILMGGSVVGIAYQIDKRLTDMTKSVIFKMLFIPAGFSAVYGVLSAWWGVAGIALACAVVVGMVFGLGSRGGKPDSSSRVSELEAKMDKCC